MSANKQKAKRKKAKKATKTKNTGGIPSGQLMARPLRPSLGKMGPPHDFIRHRPVQHTEERPMEFHPIGFLDDGTEEAIREALLRSKDDAQVVVIDSLSIMPNKEEDPGEPLRGKLENDLFTGKGRHCDEYLPYNNPKCLVWWIYIERSPAWARALAHERGTHPECFAKLKKNGKPVRLVMASRFGDVGITSYLDHKDGPYETRVWLEELEGFTDSKEEVLK